MKTISIKIIAENASAISSGGGGPERRLGSGWSVPIILGAGGKLKPEAFKSSKL